MPSTVGRIVVAVQTNKSGGAVAYGDVVITDAANDSSFTTTTSGGLTSALIGVCVEPNGIANNSSGRIQYQGECPQVNCNASVTRGNFVKTHTVAKQATGSASRANGVFGVALTTGSTPKVLLWGWPDVSASGNVATDAIWDAAGDLAVGSGADTASKLARGTAGQVLASDGSTLVWRDGTTRLDEKVASGGATASFDFTSIPGTYRDLEIHFQVRGLASATEGSMNLRLNNYSGANYECQRHMGVSTTSSADTFDAKTSMENIIAAPQATGTAGAAGIGKLFIARYAGTTFHKMVEARGLSFTSSTSATNIRSFANGGVWFSTAAITRITIYFGTGNVADGSVATLYGVA